ncbi:hypothetical protein [Azospirillum sp. TSO5]|uniref:hypothetical protein n=1 Tax=Azospirillum sp. TSO5 TaxID=716760 RepID=UPI000D60FC6C|nr:hypothetical protein [Azospirillum sp. TSO5]PWC96977.1 hypothetical protein TSO5_05985 [Azospirillum sp. TSO5]
MGLDCSHDAFHGAYSAFNRFRQTVARAMGGSFPPHYAYGMDNRPIPQGEFGLVVDPLREDGMWYWGRGYEADTHPGLYEFFTHSDCDGEIAPDMCLKVADELEALLSDIERVSPSEENGHIARAGGYVEVTKRFIAGCRAAAAAGEPLTFG